MTDTSTSNPAATPTIACTLTPGDYADRTAWIAELNRTQLRARRQNELTLELVYAPSATAQLQELIRREGECCAFLGFELLEDADAVRLCVTAPPGGREAVGLLLAPFLTGADRTVATRSGYGIGSRLPTLTVPAECSGTACACEAAPMAPASTSAEKDGEAGEGVRSPAGGTLRGRLARAGTWTGTAAVACGICCVLPFALPAVALTSLGGVLATFAGGFRWARDLALVVIAAGWLLVMWRSVRAQRPPARATLEAMGLATLITVVALGWPLVERPLIAWLKR